MKREFPTLPRSARRQLDKVAVTPKDCPPWYRKPVQIQRGDEILSGPYRLLIADDNVALCETLGEYFAGVPELEVVGFAHDGKAALAAVAAQRPDILLLDIAMPECDGLAVLGTLQARGERPKVAVLSAQADEKTIARTVNLGADYFIMKPFDLPTMVQRLVQLVAPHSTTRQLRIEQQRQLVEQQVTEHIASLGVPQHYKGYAYLRDAVVLVVHDSSLLGRITKGLYPAIANSHHTTAHKVERAIRHAIEVTWTKGNLQVIHQLFAYSVDQNRGKPTNSSFIARLADQVRMQLRVG